MRKVVGFVLVVIAALLLAEYAAPSAVAFQLCPDRPSCKATEAANRAANVGISEQIKEFDGQTATVVKATALQAAEETKVSKTATAESRIAQTQEAEQALIMTLSVPTLTPEPTATAWPTPQPQLIVITATPIPEVQYVNDRPAATVPTAPASPPFIGSTLFWVMVVVIVFGMGLIAIIMNAEKFFR